MAEVAQVLADIPTPAVAPAGAEERKRRSRIAEALMLQGIDTSPIQSWTQGAARVAQALVGGYESNLLDRQERAGSDKLAALLAADPALGGGGVAAATPATPASTSTAPKSTLVGDNPDYSAPSAGQAPPAIRFNNPGAQWPGPSASAYGATGSAVIGGGNKIAQFPDPVSGAAAQFDLLGKRYAGMPLNAAVAKWSGNNNPGTYTLKVAQATGLSPDSVLTPELLRGPQGLALAKAMAAHEAGRPYPLTDEQWAEAQSRAFPSAPGATGSVSPATAPIGSPGAGGSPATATQPTAAAAASGAAAPGARMQTPMDPQMRAYVQTLLASRDPVAIARAQQIITQYSKPQELKPVTVGEKVYTFNPATGAYSNPIDAGKPKYHKLDDGTLFEEGSGTVKPVAAAGYHPVTDPAERARFGIPPEDKRPYQIGPGGKLVNPPPETRISIDQKAEGSFETHGGQYQAKRFDDLVKQSYDAKAMISDLNYLRDIGSRISTGKTAEIQEALGPYAEALGIKVDKLDDLQAYKAVVSRLQPRMRVAGSGATSDYEMRTFLEALPSLGKTQEGNAVIANTLEALQQQHLAAGEIASKALAGEIKRADAEKQLRELPDPFELWKKSHGGRAPSQKTSSGVTFSVVD